MEQSKETQPVSEEIKHTPGPWFPVEYSGFWEIQLADEYSMMDNLLDEGCNPNAQADAKLMASAPQMFGEISTLEQKIIDYDKQVLEQKGEIERLKNVVYYTNKSWHFVFYQATSKMTAREIHDFWKELLPDFKAKHNI